MLENLFRGNEYFIIMSYNRYEMIGSRQQDRVLTAVKDEVVKLILESGIDSLGLGY